ncbi:hypothetical protein FRB99_005708 [Tulasnella sp. 403]|nr:hypothetical protein FRB99_005708 [Tulasnella sp. 403]
MATIPTTTMSIVPKARPALPTITTQITKPPSSIGFTSPFWRNTIIVGILGYGLYQFSPSRKSVDGNEGSLTSWLRNKITPSDIWRTRNEKHLELSMDAAEAKNLTGSAKRPLMPRTRYPGKFEDYSPHKRIVGDDIDLSGLNIKSESFMKHPQA